MIPQNSLSSTVVYSDYLPPDDLPPRTLVSYQEGGIGLSDPTQGLQYQVWTLEALAVDAPFPNKMFVSAPNTLSKFLFETTYIQECSLAFDPNMHPAIAFVDYLGPGLWWYNATVPGYQVLRLPTGSKYPQVTLDDKRATSLRSGLSDIILTYVRDNNLYFRQLRDTFSVEYTLMVGLPVPNPLAIKVGMNEGYRLQWTIGASLY